MQFLQITLCSFLIILNYNNFVICPDPDSLSTVSKTSRKTTTPSPSQKQPDSISVTSIATSVSGSVITSTAKSSVASSTATTSTTTSKHGKTTAAPNPSGLVLDFDADKPHPDIEVGNHIPGILKYANKLGKKRITNIKGNGQEIQLTKNVRHVLCNSPFDNNVTVVFEDDSSEEYVLQPTGFEKEQDNVEEKAEEVAQVQIKKLELNVGAVGDEFASRQIENIKCYKPKEGGIISKITIDNAPRIIETDILENFVCYIEDKGTYSILVAYLNNDGQWLKYTLLKNPSAPILMDVTLIRKFDKIDVYDIFADKSTPYDYQVFEYANLKLNNTNTATLKSKSTGNKEFKLEIKDENGNATSRDILFVDNFLVPDGFTFRTIKALIDFKDMIFTYSNDNVLMHDIYTLKNERYERDLGHVLKHDLSRTKEFFDKKDLKDHRVLFLKTLVPDSVEYEISIKHYGKYKVIDFEKSEIPSFVILPNMEFYLDAENDHKLVVCENGSHVDVVMNTVSDGKRIHYIVSNDPIRGNPFLVKKRLEFDNEL